jgi:hypothetical protein
MLIFAFNIFSQSTKQTAPVLWQKYRIPEKQISIYLPKMPVVVGWADVCTETETKDYWAYAEEVVYQVRIVSKYNKGNRDFCSEKTNFGEKNLTDRIGEIKTASEMIDEIRFIQNKRQVTRIREKSSEYWIFDDPEKDKWVELIVTHHDGVKSSKERFINSLEFTDNSTGIVVSEGSQQTLGDEIAENAKNVSDKTNLNFGKAKVEPIMIISKPRANYTEAARRNSVKGTVALEVTFLSNGGIGDITPDAELPDGLTEEVISAVKKIVFLPQRVNGISVTVIKKLQYSFSIY